MIAFSHARHWVVRCVCGNHEMRNVLTLQKRSPHAMCQECRAIAHMRGEAQLLHTPLKEMTRL